MIISSFFTALYLGLIWSIMALGVYIAYRILDIADLGAEGAFPLGGAVAVTLLIFKFNPFLAIFIATLAGGLAGLITALLHTKLKIPSLLSGIITMVGLYSIMMLIIGLGRIEMQRLADPSNFSWRNVVSFFYISSDIPAGSQTIFTPLANLFAFMAPKHLKTSIIVTSLLIVGFVFSLIYWFFGTQFGVGLRAVGKNKQMAKAQGINPHVMIIVGLVISNGLVALSGAMYSMMMRSANGTFGRGTIVIGLAIVFLGEALFGQRSFKLTLVSLITGAILYYVIITIAANLLNIDQNLFNFIQAALITVIIVAPRLKDEWRTKINKKKGGINYVKH